MCHVSKSWRRSVFKYELLEMFLDRFDVDEELIKELAAWETRSLLCLTLVLLERATGQGAQVMLQSATGDTRLGTDSCVLHEKVTVYS